MAYTVGSHQRDLHTPRQGDNGLVARFFIAIPMTLDFSVNVAPAKCVQQTVQTSPALYFADGDGERPRRHRL